MSDFIEKAKEEVDRKLGKPRTEEEREKRHRELYGEEAPKERGKRVIENTINELMNWAYDQKRELEKEYQELPETEIGGVKAWTIMHKIDAVKDLWKTLGSVKHYYGW